MNNSDHLATIPSTICYLLREFYRLGWCTGTGGGISIRENDKIYLAPSGVHKEFVQENDLFTSNLDGTMLEPPKNPGLKISECTPLFMQAYKLRNAGAVLHSHSINAVLITQLFKTEFHCIDLEMIKGITGYKNSEFCRIPIIENTEYETELTDRLRNAIIEYPRAWAVLVRNHGIYVWGNTWQKAKNHVECYEFLFKAVLKMKKHGFNIPTTIQPDIIRAWVVDKEREQIEDVRNDLQEKNVRWVDIKELNELGVLSWKLDGEKNNEELENICKKRDYKNRDEIKCGDFCENYQELILKFKKEHLHSDEEIRYILGGSGYFDVRNKRDEWIRIHVVKGDMLILPEGIYHRFVPDINNYIHAMRLFKEEPKWIPIDRPADDHPSRNKYFELLKTLN